MVRASGQKFHYLDHDSDVVDESPPVQNTWYPVFHAYDVRLLWCVLNQNNDEVAAKDVEVRWTVDGQVYVEGFSLPDTTDYYIYRTTGPAGTLFCLAASASTLLAAYYTDKRGQDFFVEVRMTGVPGTNQRFRTWCVRETLELT